ncbi:PadR family transcriptional regulator [Candidatus Latescibacterota bacterium]
MKSTQLEIAALAKICNEALILSALSDGQRHGYQIALEIEEKSRGMFQFNHGTLYPILHKLEKIGYIRGNWKHPEGERKRKYYTLTSSGKKYLKELNIDLKTFFNTLFSITGGKL